MDNRQVVANQSPSLADRLYFIIPATTDRNRKRSSPKNEYRHHPGQKQTAAGFLPAAALTAVSTPSQYYFFLAGSTETATASV